MPVADAEVFAGYAAALRAAGVAAPTLLVDLDALDANTAAVRAVVPGGMALRIAAKSLPVPALLRRVLGRLGTDRIMTFSVAMLEQIEQALPGLAPLFGKPVPAAAVRRLLESGERGLSLAQRTVWLVDTLERVGHYAAVARDRDIVLPVALEIDVGLHRGGFADPASLRDAVKRIVAERGLRYAGLMGYEPHLPAVPRWAGLRARAVSRFRRSYAAAVETAGAVVGAAEVQASIRNTAGSRTLADRAGESSYNDLSVGSLLVKPLDFDTVISPPTRPAVFIATPVLKVVDPLRIPGLGGGRMLRAVLAGGARRGVHIHGGHWLADPVHPPGLAPVAIFGRSSNQELLATRGPLGVAVDDFVFLRPRQSEGVMLQFGPVAAIRGGAVEAWWEPFPPTA